MNADSILLLIAAVITWGILYEVKVCVWCVDYEMKLHQENLRRDNESMKVACNTLPMMNQKDKIESLVTDELIIVKKMTNFELLSLILNNLSYCAKCVLLLIWQGLIVVKWRREDWTRRNKDCCENVKVSCEKVAFVVKVWKGKLQKWMKNVLLKTERYLQNWQEIVVLSTRKQGIDNKQEELRHSHEIVKNDLCESIVVIIEWRQHSFESNRSLIMARNGCCRVMKFHC